LQGGRVLLLLVNLGSEPIADLAVADASPLYATPAALGDNGTLAPWGVLCYLLAVEPEITIGGEPLWR
jgi:hypothetical protein